MTSKRKNAGYIYIMSNPCFRYLKIGITKLAPEQRAKQLSDSTSIPLPFKVEFTIAVDELDRCEGEIHSALIKYRVKKEFFDIPLNDAILKVKRLAFGFACLYDPLEALRTVAEINLGISPEILYASNTLHG